MGNILYLFNKIKKSGKSQDINILFVNAIKSCGVSTLFVRVGQEVETHISLFGLTTERYSTNNCFD